MEPYEYATAYLERDRPRYADLLEVLRRGSADLLYTVERGLLLHDSISGAHLLTAETDHGAQMLLERIPADADLCLAHQDFYLPALRKKLGLTEGMVCHQAIWPEREPPSPLPHAGELRPLERSAAGEVALLYAAPFADERYVAEAIDRGMLGIFAEGELAGFIGTHDEGSMGMLHVRPQYRLQGLAEALERAMIARLLARGEIPFAHVTVGNAPSLALQHKLGMALGSDLIHWVF